MATELEFKLAVPNPAMLEQILFDSQVAEVRQGDYELYNMATVYYDTPDHRLSNLRWTLRLRQENDCLVASLKTPGDGHARGEWECPAYNIRDAIPVLLELGAPQELRSMLEGQELYPLCAAQFTRRVCKVSLPGDTVCELCGDIGQLAGGGKEEALCELELELNSGSADMAQAYAAELQDRFGLQEELRSKFQRASALAKN